MKKIILLVFVTLFCCVGYSQAQTTKKMTRQEKKEAQKAIEQSYGTSLVRRSQTSYRK